MKFKYTFITFLLLNCTIFSQENEETYYRSILLSVKAGHRTGYNLSYDRGLPYGLVWGGSIDFGVSKLVLLGINFDYWKKDNVVTHPYLTDITINKNFSGFGYRVYVQFRKTVYKIINLYADLGFGRYRISYNYYYGNSFGADDNYYLNAGFSFGAGIKVNKFLYISGEVSHFRLIKFLTEGSGVFTTNIKFGPTFFIQLK